MKKHSLSREKTKFVNHLSRAEGQLRSLKEKIQSDHDPIQVLQQLKAATKSVDQLSKQLLVEYLKCELGGAGKVDKRVDLYLELVKKYG